MISTERFEEVRRILIAAKRAEVGVEVAVTGPTVAAYNAFMEVRNRLAPEFDDLRIKTSPNRTDALWVYHNQVKMELPDGEE